jgi:hypothetical protein
MAKRVSAYIQGLNEEQKRIELEQKSASNEPQPSMIEPKPSEKAVSEPKIEKEVLNKTTLYFSTPQLKKFDDLIAQYKKFTNINLKRSDIAQIMIDRITIEDLLPKIPPLESMK